MSNFYDLNNQENNDFIIEKIAATKNSLQDCKMEEILDCLSALRKLWKKDGKYYLKVLSLFKDNKDIREQLNLMESLLDRKLLIRRLKGDFDRLDFLDQFSVVEEMGYAIYYAPLGKLLHITASNVELGAIDSLIMGILTRNLNLVKISRAGNEMLKYFVESFLEVEFGKKIFDNIFLLSWKGGNQSVEKRIFKSLDAVIFWGGGDALSSLKKNLPSDVLLIEHGPKISIQVISKCAYENDLIIYDKIIDDIITWNQSACSCCQNIFLEEGIDVGKFIEKIKDAYFKEKRSKLSISSDEAVERLKDYFEGLYYEFKESVPSFRCNDFQIQFDHEILNPTALNNSVKVKVFKNIESLSQMLKNFSFYLQTCALAVLENERAKFLTSLSNAGIVRFTRIGEMLKFTEGTPHDGKASLKELTRACVDEREVSIDEFVNQIDIPLYRDKEYRNLKEYPLVEKSFFEEDLLHSSKSLLSKKFNSEGGFFYSSGGTTGRPKFVYYTNREFDLVARELAKSYQENGIQKKEVVANLFMSGNLWSSFNAVQRALEYCDVVQLPIGGHVKSKDFYDYAKYFNIETVFGLPSILTEIAGNTPGLSISKVFYAGEKMSEGAKRIIQMNWNNPEIISAGYASVDVGPIAYQDKTCKGNEHILFSKLVYLEIVDGEAVVSSKVRSQMPVIRYRTGDKVRILEQSSKRTKIELLGRVDQKINIWGCRFELSDFSTLMLENSKVESFQIQMSSEVRDLELFEILNINYLGQLGCDEEDLKKMIYSKLTDICNTREYSFVAKRIEFNCDAILYHPKTGKKLSLIDQRSL